MVFSDFNHDENIMSTDLSKQDSKFNHVFVWFITFFLTSLAPKGSHEAIEWIISSGYTHKHFVLPTGEVVTFENGEPSGFPFTILMNSFYNYFLYALSHLVHVQRNSCQCPLKVITLGDDACAQNCTNSLDDYRDVCAFLNHSITGNVTPFRGLSYLTQSFASVGFATMVPYYDNIPKGIAACKYWNGIPIDYYHKLCAFRSDTYFSPVGTPERRFHEKVCMAITKLVAQFHLTYDNTYMSETMLRASRLGYQSGGLNLNMVRERQEKQVNKTLSVMEGRLNRRVHALEQSFKKVASVGLTPEEKNSVASYVTKLSLANEPVSLPRAVPTPQVQLSFGGTREINNDARQAYNHALFNPMNLSTGVQTGARQVFTNAGLRCASTFLVRKNSQTVTNYYLGVPLQVNESSITEDGYFNFPARMEQTTSSDAVLGLNGAVFHGKTAFYPILQSGTGSTASWTAEGDIPPSASITVETDNGSGWVELATELLSTGSISMPAYSGNRDVRIKISFPSNDSCDSRLSFRFNFTFAVNGPKVVNHIESVFDYSNSTTSEGYVADAELMSTNAASLFLKGTTTAFTQGALICGLVASSIVEHLGSTELYEYMASRRIMRTEVTDLSDGAFVTWVPRSKTDLLFRPPKMIPQSHTIVFVWKNIVNDDSVAAISIEPRVACSFITDNNFITPTIPKSRVFKLVLAYHMWLLNNNFYMHENATHISSIKKGAKKFLGSDEFHQILKTLGTAAISTVAALL